MHFGLLGKSLKHSFSRAYFSEKFEREGLSGFSYSNFEIEDISLFPDLIAANPQLNGLNVTIPYKESVIPFLDEISSEAEEIGAVNTISIHDGKLKGYNTDVFGFTNSLKPLLKPHHKKALILGTGGASKAVAFALQKLDIQYIKISRTPSSTERNYTHASEILDSYPLVINTTPLGTYPKTAEIPPLALDKVSENHLFYDLIYNPAETALLKAAAAHGAQIKNGHDMLVLQAEKAWEIWNELQMR